MLLSNSGWHWQIDWTPFIIAAIVLVALAYFFAFPLLIARAAKNHGRSGVLWFIFSLFISPLLALLFLIALGDTDAKRKERWLREEQIKNMVQNRQPTTTSSNDDNDRLKQLLAQSRRS